jgi:hypothetical protein
VIQRLIQDLSILLNSNHHLTQESCVSVFKVNASGCQAASERWWKLTIQQSPFKVSWLSLDENDRNLGFFSVILYPLSKPLVLLAYTEAPGTTSVTGVVFTCTASSFINWQVSLSLTK